MIALQASLAVFALCWAGRSAWAQGEPVEPHADGPFASARIGAWLIDDFKTLTAAGPREIRSEKLLDAGIDGGYAWSGWIVRAGLDFGQTGDVSIMAGSTMAGRTFPLPVESILPVPAWAELSAGLIGGQLRIGDAAFGKFDAGVGFMARVSISAAILPDASVFLWADYRRIDFGFSDALSGDSSAGGGMLAFGLGGSLRF